jgi:hypothetical protein
MDLSLILQICTLLGIIWGVYSIINKPKERSELIDAVFEERLKNIEIQVSNHIPTAIKEVCCKLDKHIEEQIKFEKDILIRLK